MVLSVGSLGKGTRPGNWMCHLELETLGVAAWGWQRLWTGNGLGVAATWEWQFWEWQFGGGRVGMAAGRGPLDVVHLGLVPVDVVHFGIGPSGRGPSGLGPSGRGPSGRGPSRRGPGWVWPLWALPMLEECGQVREV